MTADEPTPPARDRVYRDPRNQIVDFAFDETVAEVFTDMIRRSVPGYETVVPMTGLIAARALADGDTAFDLGCWTATGSRRRTRWASVSRTPASP
jgi:tRNA (cmo5U34)-methyltransferase